MDKLQKEIAALMPEGVFLIDLQEDLHRGAFKFIIDSEKVVDANLTSQLARKIRNSRILDRYYPQGWSLEVSSPGVEAELQFPFQYRKNRGRILTLLIQAGEQEVEVKGELKQVDENSILIEKSGGQEVFIPFEKIIRAKVVLQFN